MQPLVNGKNMQTNQIIHGKVFPTLVKFALPVMLALFLQALYGAVDMWVVGRYAETSDVSGVSTGSMLIQTVTMIISGLSVGVTVLVGRRIGQEEYDLAARAIGGGIFIFSILAIIFTSVSLLLPQQLATLMNAPSEAFDQTVQYIMICGGGFVFIIAYNLLGSIFRGIGDSKTPLITVAIACLINIPADILFVKVLHMGAAGASCATVMAQAVSVLISLIVIKKKDLPFKFRIQMIKPQKSIILTELGLGVPIAFQELLVGISFLVIMAIVNSIDVASSAGVGVAEKVCAFIMLVPSAFSQSMSAFVAQNMGAQKTKRAQNALICGILTSFACGLVMFYLAFFHGDILCGIFSKESDVILRGHSYLKAYAIDCLLTPFLFCFIGYFSGLGRTTFVMLQGIVGAFFVRIPVVYLISRIKDCTLFQIGLATPCSTTVQIILCLIMLIFVTKTMKNKKSNLRI